MRFLIFAPILFLLGCSTIPATSLDDTALCIGYGLDSMRYNQNDLRQELTRRGLVNNERWPQIDNDQVAVGMTRCELFAAWALNPLMVERDTYSSGSGQMEVFTYDRIGLNGPELGRIVYVIDGRVSSISQL